MKDCEGPPGKEEREQLTEEASAQKYCIIIPIFIDGGEDFGLNPPRLLTGLGEIIKALLYLLRCKLHRKHYQTFTRRGTGSTGER